MKKIIFNDASELPIHEIVLTEEGLKIKTNYATLEDLKKKFLDELSTKCMTIVEDGEVIEGPYLGYIKAVSFTFYTANMYEVIMTKAEKTSEKINEQLNAAIMVARIQAQSLSDTEAISVKAIYPSWEESIGQTVEMGYKFLYGEKLYKTIQPDDLVIEEQYIPGEGTESLYTVINEAHTGTADDPIPYDGNMELNEGLYYSQDETVYLCTRSTGQPVYNALIDLIGIYVEVNSEGEESEVYAENGQG